jgi:membrane protease YdiL (CAAX protease family)
MQVEQTVAAAERALLRALVQTADADLTWDAARRLARYGWQDREHALIFEAWQRCRRRGRPTRREELAAALVRLGFPEVALEDLFVPLADPAAALRAALDRLERGGRVRRLATLADIVGLPAVILLYIWRWQATHPLSWLIFPVWLVASIVVHRDSPRRLGWRADNLVAATAAAALFFVPAAAVLLLVGWLRGASLEAAWRLFSLRHALSYFAFCMVQQVALNSLLTNRLLEWLPPPAAAAVAGVIFAAAHWPNPVLVPVTLVGGVAMAWLFARCRNILPLAAGQALAGLLVWWAFPAGWHHNLRVGPGYGLWKP